MAHEQPGCDEFRQRNGKISKWELLHVGFHPEGSKDAPIGVSCPHEARALFAVFDEERNVRGSLRFVLNLFGKDNMEATGLSIQLTPLLCVPDTSNPRDLAADLACNHLPDFILDDEPIRVTPKLKPLLTEETVHRIHGELNKVFVANREL